MRSLVTCTQVQTKNLGTQAARLPAGETLALSGATKAQGFVSEVSAHAESDRSGQTAS